METGLSFLGFLSAIWPTALTLVLVVAGFVTARYILNRRYRSALGYQFRIQVILLTMTLGGFVLLILSLPISDSKTGQLLSLFGLLVSAAIALSSTTFLGNIMAGLMQRAVQNFRPGDFIRVEGHFGRVTELGLIHVEIQTEDRDLTTMPNLFLATHPVKVIRSSGTLTSAEVSLGYDVPKDKIKACLLQAAQDAGLEEPFVRVRELGDFSIVYQISGLLKEVKGLLSANSRLREAMLDRLHEARIEIVSPNFMNQRVLQAGQQFIPEQVRAKPVQVEAEHMPEELIFDKAEEAQTLEELRQLHEKLRQELKEKESLENHPERAVAEDQLRALRNRFDRLTAYLSERSKEEPKS